MSDDLCYFCGKDVGGVYTRYWDNKCHIECEPEYVAKKKTSDEITALRERLEQAERERDEAEKTVLMTDHMAGFRAGIEAAAREVPKKHVLCDLMIRSISDIQKAIRALSPTDNTTSVAEAAKVICDAWDADTLPVNAPDPMLPSFIAALRTLAEQTGGE